MSGPKKNHGSHHHIGKIATKLKPVKHVYRPRRLCEGNAAYERAMADAKTEFDRQMSLGRERSRRFRT